MQVECMLKGRHGDPKVRMYLPSNLKLIVKRFLHVVSHSLIQNLGEALLLMLFM